MDERQIAILELFAEAQRFGERTSLGRERDGLSSRYDLRHYLWNHERGSSRAGLNCSRCGVPGHRVDTCSNIATDRVLTDAERARLHVTGCFICGKRGHRSTSCLDARPLRRAHLDLSEPTQDARARGVGGQNEKALWMAGPGKRRGIKRGPYQRRKVNHVAETILRLVAEQPGITIYRLAKCMGRDEAHARPVYQSVKRLERSGHLLRSSGLFIPGVRQTAEQQPQAAE